MSRGERTKEERFLVKLFEIATEKECFDTPVDRYTVGQAVNFHNKGVDSITKQLMRTNFIKKSGPREIYLTQNGLNLVEILLSD